MIIEGLVPKLLEAMEETDVELVSEYVTETKTLLIDSGMPEDMITEGFLGNLIGGAAGFFIGPSIGKVIARVLGIEKGIVYDLLTSRLVGTALGLGISKSLGKKK
jgi:hypothetical protein